MANHYLKPFWRSVIALIAILIFLLYDQDWDFATAFTTPFFYLAFTVCMVVALLLMYYVQRISMWLDRRAPWREAPWYRSGLQILYGVLIPIAADTGLMAIYFAAIGKDMVERGFFEEDLPLILLFLLGLNLLYFGMALWYQLTHRETELNDARTQIKTADENEVLAQFEIPYEGGILLVDVRTNILAFFREDRRVWALDITGKRYVIPQTLEVLTERFAPLNFQPPNRSTIVNVAFVKRYRSRDPKGETFQIVFTEEILTAIDSPDDPKYRITEKYFDYFLIKFKGKN